MKGLGGSWPGGQQNVAQLPSEDALSAPRRGLAFENGPALLSEHLDV